MDATHSKLTDEIDAVRASLRRLIAQAILGPSGARFLTPAAR